MTGTRDQVQQPALGGSEHAHSRESVEGLELQGLYLERHLMAGRVRYIDPVPRLKAVQLAEDGRTLDAVEMPVDDRLAECSRLRSGLQPTGVPDIARDVHETAGRDADRLNHGVDAERGNADAIGDDRAGRRLEQSNNRP